MHRSHPGGPRSRRYASTCGCSRRCHQPDRARTRPRAAAHRRAGRRRRRPAAPQLVQLGVQRRLEQRPGACDRPADHEAGRAERTQPRGEELARGRAPEAEKTRPAPALPPARAPRSARRRRPPRPGRRSGRAARRARPSPRPGRRGTSTRVQLAVGRHARSRAHDPAVLEERRAEAGAERDPDRAGVSARGTGPPLAEQERIGVVQEANHRLVRERRARRASSARRSTPWRPSSLWVISDTPALVVERPGDGDAEARRSPASRPPAPPPTMAASSSSAAAAGRQRRRRPALGPTAADGMSTRPAVTCVPPMSSAPTTPHGTNALITLHGSAADPLQPVAADRGGDHDRLGVREAVHVARPALDLDLVAVHEVEHVEPSARCRPRPRPSKSSRCTAKNRSGEPAERELAPARAARGPTAAPGIRSRRTASPGGAGRGSRTRARRGPAAARRRDRGAASRRSAACRGTASR